MPTATRMSLWKWLVMLPQRNIASAEIEEMIWLTTADKDKISSVDQLIFEFLKHNNLIM
jgi:hypothetical protein